MTQTHILNTHSTTTPTQLHTHTLLQHNTQHTTTIPQHTHSSVSSATSVALPQSLLNNSEISNIVFGALEACLCFGCGGNLVPKDFDHVHQTPSRNGSLSSSALVRILRLLKHSPEMFAQHNNQADANAPRIYLRPCFFLSESLIQILQRQFDMYPNLQGPASYSSAVREPFMDKMPASSNFATASSTASPVSPVDTLGTPDTLDTLHKPATIVFGYQSRIMSLTEMPPNEVCRLSRVRVVVRDVTGRFCWDLIPASADPEGSEALCYHKVVATPVSTATIDAISTAIFDATNTANTANTGVGATSALNSEHATADEATDTHVPSAILRNERTNDLLEFIGNQDTDASKQFERFVADFDPHHLDQQQTPQTQHTTQCTYKAQVTADQVHGLGCGTLTPLQDKVNAANAANEGNTGKPHGKLSVTRGAPESGCRPVLPAIQPASLTSFDRCRQALAHLGFLGPAMLGELVLLKGDDENKLRGYLSTLDKLRPRMGYRIAVLYVGELQETQHEIMHSTTTTASFLEFLNSLGWKVNLYQHRTNGCFMGGLDPKLHKHMLYYGSSVREVSFHVVPWMPVKKNDEQQIERKRHVGNDTVHIVWCDNPKGYDVSTFVSMVTDIFLVLIPLGNRRVKVQIFSRDKTLMFGPLQDGCIVQRSMIGFLARMTAINAIDSTRKSKIKSDSSENNKHEVLHPSFYRRKRIQSILSRLSTEVSQKELASSLFG